MDGDEGNFQIRRLLKKVHKAIVVEPKKRIDKKAELVGGREGDPITKTKKEGQQRGRQRKAWGLKKRLI